MVWGATHEETNGPSWNVKDAPCEEGANELGNVIGMLQGAHNFLVRKGGRDEQTNVTKPGVTSWIRLTQNDEE